MLLLVSSIKLVTEIALMALLGQGLLGVCVGARKDGNFFYKLLHSAAQPFISLARRVTPRQVLDRHLPWVAAVLLAVVWIAALAGKVFICLSTGMQLCR